MKESKYFKESEFKCKCGKCELPKNVPSDALVMILEQIREHFNKPLIINSGYRCKTHNKAVGGAENSQHYKGSAADFVIKGVKTSEVLEYVLLAFKDLPLGIAGKIKPNSPYGGFVHIDTRGYKARWNYD